MKKYRCPKCKAEFQGKLEYCPKCGTQLHYLDEEVKKEAESAAPRQEFFYDDDRILKEGIKTEEEQAHERSQVDIRHLKEEPSGESYFDGKLIQLIGWRLLGTLLTVVTLTFGFPAAMCMVYRWECRHTVIEGRRLDFDGKASQLFGRYCLWLLLSILTVGIFLFWLAINLRKWKAKHTIFQTEKAR